MRETIGLFGGTFDPVHNGHLAIARSFLETDRLSELWILLTPFPPHKVTKDHANYEVRHEMLEAAFSGYDETRILTIENELPKPSYSIQTIRYLKKHHPDKDFFFCMGEDSLSSFDQWKDYQEILNEVRLMVAYRPGTDHTGVAEEIMKRTQFVDHVPVDISSSGVRNSFKHDENSKGLVPAKVEDIIHRESLYM